MYQHLTGYNITITNLGSRDCPLELYLHQPCERGEPLTLIHQLVTEEAVHHPDGIIILSGSDVANIDFDILSLEERQSKREVYAASLRSIINSTLSANRYIAISSPGTVLGEGPWYIPPGHPPSSPPLLPHLPTLSLLPSLLYPISHLFPLTSFSNNKISSSLRWPSLNFPCFLLTCPLIPPPRPFVAPRSHRESSIQYSQSHRI